MDVASYVLSNKRLPRRYAPRNDVWGDVLIKEYVIIKGNKE